jgi:spore coat polysaccharide biosynthesis predicted glycosyltransferase SpsG
LLKLKKISKLIIFDDNNDVYDSSIPDVIINGNIHAFNLNYDKKPKKLLGPKYLVMKEEYWNSNFKGKNKCTNNDILITTGGSDSNRILSKIIEVMNNIDANKKIVIGPMFEEEYIKLIENKINKSFEIIYKPSSLKKYIENSKIIITASGSTIYEVLILKKPPLIFTIAKNQELIAKELEKFGVINLGNYDNLNFSNLGKVIHETINNLEVYINKLKKLFDLFDGKGAIRVAKSILEHSCREK